MDKKHLIMGTAGHVDHGKTSLIKALTGFDCDTHKQEKQRGITINLGFTHVDLPDGNSIGIVDVPGHADFIKTMVTGACGMDFVMLIIAADEGVMPQTAEHLEIMNILGIKKGLIVLTKIDMVDEELLELAMEEVKEFSGGSFLENAPVLPVSSVTNSGIKELFDVIMDLIPDIPEKNEEGSFRMYIDRIFSQPGFGTIVNGSVLAGKINKTDPLYLLPGEREIRIRKLQRHGIDVDCLKAGDRGSLNLVNLKIKDFRKGMMISSRPLGSTTLCDASITLFEKDVELGLWNQVIFLLGTIRQMVRIHLLNKDKLGNGEEALVQIYLPRPVIMQINDPFIIRNSSGDKTLGGGIIIDPYPLHHRRRRKPQIEIVQKMASGDVVELLAAEVRKSILPVSYRVIAELISRIPDDLIEIIFQELPGDLFFYQTQSDILLFQKKRQTALQNKILGSLENFHKKHPLLGTGRTFNELMGIFGNEQNETTKTTLDLILHELLESNKISNEANTYILYDHSVEMDDKTRELIDQIEEYLNVPGRLLVDLSEIQDNFTGSNAGEKKLQQVISHMISTNKVRSLQKKYISTNLLTKFKDLTVDFLKTNESGISVAQFRDMISGNRNTAMVILEHLDSEGITIRKGNFRVLTQKFIKGSSG